MLSVNLCLLFGSFGGTARRYLNLRQYRGLQKRAPHAVRHLFVAVIASIISYASRVSTNILTNIMQASLRCCSRFFSAVFSSHPSSLHPGIPAHASSFSPIIPRAIPHNSKCRYGERGAADAKPKAQIILDAAKVSAASGGNSEPKQGQRSQSARGFCPRSTMRVAQPDIIEHFGNADAVPQLPERCLSRKAGIVRCCLKAASRPACGNVPRWGGWLL